MVWLAVMTAGLGPLVMGPDAAAGLFGKRKPADDPETRQLTTGALRVLQGQCFGCHSPEKDKGGLVLTSREALLAGGDSGKVVVPRRPEKSLLLRVLPEDADPHMPPNKQLPAQHVDLLRRWILAGVPWDPGALERLNAPRGVVLEPLPETYRPVQGLALDPEARRLAWASGTDLVVQDLSQTNTPVLFRAQAHADVVRSVAWSTDGRWLATGGFRELTVWKVADFSVAWTTRSNLLGRITALRFSPHGGALLAADGAASEAGWVRVFASDSGRPIVAWKAHTDTIFDLAVSADGGVVATAGGDRLVKTWEILSQREVARFEGHVGAVLGVAFNPSGSELVSVGADKQLKLWDTRTREAVVTIGGRRHNLNAVAWAADGSRVAAVDEDGRLYGFTEFKRHTGEQSSATARERALGRWPDALSAVAISRDGALLVAGGEDGQVRVVDSEGKLKATLSPPPPAVASDDPAAALAAVAPTPAPEHPPAEPRRRGRRKPGVRPAERISEVGAARAVVGRTDSNASGQADPGSGAAAVAAAGTVHEPDPSFVQDVLPVLAKAGCSAGSCHAKADGQNGFKLSVFSYDPAADHAEIVKEARGRRVFPASPDESLLVLKATGVLEHGGGQRIDPESEAHQLLRRWIRSGMPYRRAGEPELAGVAVSPGEGTYERGGSRELRVEARYSDGTTRDVTHLAEYESNDKEIVQVDARGRIKVGDLGGEAVIVARYMGFVDASRVTVPSDRGLPAERYDALPVNNFIDRLAHDQFRKLGLYPSGLCTDEEFIRRMYLDTLGVLPTEAELRRLLRLPPGQGVRGETGASTDSTGESEAQIRERRSAWIREVMARPEFADYWANKWADLLRPNPDRVGVKSVFVLDQWLRDWFRSGGSYDAFVREILLAEGTNHRDGPVVVYRDRRDPPEITTLFSQLFLGVRMECAKCHHHPNEKWSQEDFYRFAAVFGPMKQKGAGLSPPISAGTETFYFAPGGTVKHPVTDVVMKPKAPDGPELGADGEDPRRAFVDWLVGPGNPYFARAAVNRVWAAFFGRGFVEPVDDFRVSNPASNEPLLDALARDFADNGFDLKHLVRTILESRTYQLSSTPNEHNLTDTRNFSRSYRRRLPAEVLLDAVNDITGIGDDFNGCPPGTRAIQTWSYKVSSQFLDAFGRPNPSSDCPCERDVRTSVVQALHLMNSRRIHEKLASPEGRARRLADSDLPPTGIVTELYLATLSRVPTPAEMQAATAAFETDNPSPDTRRAATEDVLWALLNSAEFVFNH